MDLAAVAADLYGSMPGDFVSRRTEAAKGSADKETAKAIRALPKPSTAAWMVNMLARHRRGRLDEVLALGASLRAAQEELDADRLRALSADRRKLLGRLEKEAAALAVELGQNVSASIVAEVREHLQAAMADAAAGAATAGGLLVRTVSADGLDPADLAGAVAVPGAVGTPAPAKRDGSTRIEATRLETKRAETRARKLREAREAADLARQRAEEDADRQRSAAETVEALGQRRSDVAGELERLRRDLAAVEDELGVAGSRLEAATRRATDSRRDAERKRKSAEVVYEDGDGDAG